MNILHISDLHLDEPSSCDEILRTGFYEEYIQELTCKIKNENVDKQVSHIFVSGDVVESAKVKHFSHAKNVLTLLADCLNVPLENVYIVNGNHDVPRATGCLDDFNQLTKNFFQDSSSVVSNIYSFKKHGNNDGVLCLNSIGSSYQTGLPHKLSDSEIDEIVLLIKSHNINNLFVISHHPPISYSVQAQAPFDEGDPQWSAKHIWFEGGNLFRRLSKKVNVKECLFWFSGDVHRPEYCVIDGGVVLSICGAFNAKKSDTNKPRPLPHPQARIIQLGELNEVQIYEYVFSGHNARYFEGAWELRKQRAKTYSNNDETKSDSPVSPVVAVFSHSLPVAVNQKIQESATIGVISEPFEKTIHDIVKNNGLYKFGRFDTNDNISSLAWVSIHGIMQQDNVFDGIIKNFNSKIKSLLPDGLSLKQCLLIGVDSWGSIISSRLSISTNIRSCCVAVRCQRGSYDGSEVVNQNLKNIVKGKKFVFVISDVISTGFSVSKLRQELESTTGSQWYSLSVIYDPSQERLECFNGYSGMYYLCGPIKIPIIRKEQLPEHNLLNADISFL